MSDEQTDTGTGWPQPAGPARPGGPAGEPDPRPDAPDPDELSPLAPQEPVEPQEPDEDPAVEPGVEPVDDGATVDLSAVSRSGEPVAGSDGLAEPAGESEAVAGASAAPVAAGRSRWSTAGAMIVVLLALLGFTLVVQLKTTSTDPTLGATRQEDLVRILSDLDARESRLQQDIRALEDSQRQLRSGEQGRQAALDEATRRADELGILAGTLPAVGPGLTVQFDAGLKPITANRVLDAVQELRGAGAEAMQISGGDRATVRVIASTYFLDGDNGSLVVEGRRLTGPYTITVIGDPATMRTALNIPGGVVASVRGGGGNVTFGEREVAEVSALHAPIRLEHARPVS
ncbi:DUF881 domain-containing protein [Micromonospora parathelypteridis]|uniref:Uncharacterized protein YlxW (UPF0749 family) n=1 Tax=Micromonospora parathelypteridis TaxID=1839617 RepID=A0A840WBV9_9ACTN|nr:DUF881 domain-containing protein [Micromonospora parathelypteridis]MBB5481659.1 uncharacterized protein YlxW (UPF0749 family) [Micromonospora parathelypteridis]GGO28761.1 hypothetical protein GCM10011576_54780 [Micromonospora parathelypteridis]